MLFHCSIAQATHNEFMSRLEPVLQESIQKGYFFMNMNMFLIKILFQIIKRLWSL